ncbi:MAG: helix-turn-helix domain-containing protein [Fimbriimonadaceae bacterium]|nr:helix-turn-helix domain-containing protein [Alphaproteobacteria bacterium]
MMQKKRPHPVDVHVGGRIRMRRILLNMSQEKLGDQLGLTFQQVQKYEKGSNRIGASRLWELSRILDVPISFFYEWAIEANEQMDGFGESGQKDYVMNFVHSSEGLNMIRHFVKIEDANVRRSVVQMIKSLADSESGANK